MPSLPISPHAQPHSTIALQRACSPARTVCARNALSSCSFAARCASHACSSACAAERFCPTWTSGFEMLSEEPDGEGVLPRMESRVDFWGDLDALMSRVTL